MLYDLIIVGAGPAGLTAVIYAKRAFLKTLIFEKSVRGGKLNKTAEVENYPAFLSIEGPELAQKMTDHALNYGVEWSDQEVVEIRKKDSRFIIYTNQSVVFSSQAVIIASGAIENELNIKGEKEFTNRGVSYCPICDGYLFRGQAVAVVGGGYSALEAALYLSNIATKVHLIHRRDSFRTEKEIVEKVQTNPKITFFLNSVVTEIRGQVTVEKVIIQELNVNTPKELLVKAVFPCIGLTPYSQFTHQLGVCDHQSYIRIKEDCSTTIPGLFAAGDVARTERKKIKQIVTAVSEGAIAAQSVIEYLTKSKIFENKSHK